MMMLARENYHLATPGALIIAAGTPYEILVRDARGLYKWSAPSLPFRGQIERRIVYHHTAGGHIGRRSPRSEVMDMISMARSSDFGLPYNFVQMPAPPWRTYYINDVDMCWPHTFGHNCATAVAAWGHFTDNDPPPQMVGRMLALADALATMWGEWVEEMQHRDAFATECPGERLSPLLPRRDAQRGAGE